MIIEWRDGIDGYKKCTHTIDPISNVHKFNMELVDVPYTSYSSISEYCLEILSNKSTKYVDVLYSGGLDSELILALCLKNKIPVRANTMRLLVNGYSINTHDLYYSEKFCRENNVTQKIIDLDVEDFFNKGEHYTYLKPYRIVEPHVATHFWLFQQIDGFPVLGGEYSWPITKKSLLSPHRHNYNYYDKFLMDNNIDGIGNFMNYSMGGNVTFIKAHLEVSKLGIGTDEKQIPLFKQELWKCLGLEKPEIRSKSYGWGDASISVFNIYNYKIQLLKDFGITHSNITWGKSISNIINSDANTNDKYA